MVGLDGCEYWASNGWLTDKCFFIWWKLMSSNYIVLYCTLVIKKKFISGSSVLSYTLKFHGFVHLDASYYDQFKWESWASSWWLTGKFFLVWLKIIFVHCFTDLSKTLNLKSLFQVFKYFTLLTKISLFQTFRCFLPWLIWMRIQRL